MTASKRSGGTCDTMRPLKRDDGKRELPRTIQRAINSLPDFADGTIPWGKRLVEKDLKVRVCWVIAYLEGVRPNQTIPEWQRFQCSHRCLNEFCVTLVLNGAGNSHVCWESPSDNQNRGHNRNLCFRQCTHCTEFLCICQNVHSPVCLWKKRAVLMLSCFLVFFLLYFFFFGSPSGVTHSAGILKSSVPFFFFKRKAVWSIALLVSFFFWWKKKTGDIVKFRENP